MAVLGWIVRIVVVLFAVRLLLRFLASLRGGAAGPAPAQRRSRGPMTREGGRLVRDPQCGTHLPESSALRVGSGANAVYFCSTACRDQWSAARRAG